MFWIILIAAFVLAIIIYVFRLDFEIGTGFSEEKRKAREAEYRINKKRRRKAGKVIKIDSKASIEPLMSHRITPLALIFASCYHIGI